MPGIWNVTGDYYDGTKNKLYLDVDRPTLFVGNAYNALSIENTKPLQILVQYGIWNDANNKDTNRILGDTDMSHI